MVWGGKKAKQSSGESALPSVNAVDQGQSHATVIGSGAVIKGRLDAEHNLVVAGKVDGEVHCKQTVTIAAQGLVTGQIHCRSIEVHGTVEGDVRAEESLAVEATGRLIGDIYTPRFNHQPGGHFEGYSHMVKEDQTKKGSKANKGKQHDNRDAERD